MTKNIIQKRLLSKSIYNAIGCAGLVGSALILTQAVYAEGQSGLYLEEILVTAQKRESDLQSTPIAISTFSANAMGERDIFDTQSLSFAVPGLVHSEAVTNGQITLRGIGLDIPNLAGEPGVAFHVDGVYVKSLTQLTTAFSELERVEVLRGPQGTLYGRNATGGAINLITKRPTETLESELTVKLGNYDRIVARAGVSGPLSDNVSGRISYEFEERDGYAKNLFNGEDLNDTNRQSVRGSLFFNVNEQLAIIVRGDYQEDDTTGIPDQPLSGGPNDAALGIDTSLGENVVQTLVTGGRITLNPRTVFHNFDDFFEREVYGTSVEVNYDFGNLALKSITAYRSDSLESSTDSDGTDVLGLHIANTSETDQYSQELQLLSSFDGPWNFIVGLYYFDAEDFLSINADFGIPFISESNQDTESKAVFGEVYYDISDKLRATAGLRWTEDEKSFDSFNNFNPAGIANGGTFENLTPKVGLDYQFNENVFGYISISKGFKSGGFDIFGTGSSFDEEEVWAYEVGLKNTLLDNKLRLNLSGFYYDYSDLQVTQFPGDGTQFISNAATAEIYGLEVDFELIANAWLSVDGGLSILDAEYTDFVTADVLDPAGPLVNLSGNQLIRAPELSANIGVSFDLPLNDRFSSVLRIENAYVDDYYFTAFNRSPALQKSYSQTNAFLTFEAQDQSWKLSLFGKNLGDEDIRSSAFEQPAVGGYLAPRTYGAMVTLRFD